MADTIRVRNETPTVISPIEVIGRLLGLCGRYVEHCHPVLSFIHSGTPKPAGEDKRENLY
jgi:hypothetical protein